MYDVIALGETLIDFTYSGMSVSGQRLFEQNAGGAPANMLASLNQCGKKTAFIGKVGDDMHGQFLKDTLDNAGIDTKGLILDSEVFTTLAFVGINTEGERHFSFARKPGADTMLTQSDVDLDILKQTKVFHVGSLSLTNEPCKSATWYAIKKAKEFGAILTYDPNYRASLWDTQAHAVEEMKSLIPYVDVMKVSDEEAVLFTGETDIALAAKKLMAEGITLLTITLGGDGAYVCNASGGGFVKGFTSTVVDTTGAGDSFFGGFVAKMLETGKQPSEISLEEMKEFAKFGNAVASLCVEKRGGIPAIPTLAESMKRYNNVI